MALSIYVQINFQPNTVAVSDSSLEFPFIIVEFPIRTKDKINCHLFQSISRMKWKLLFFSQLYYRADERDQRFDVTVEKGEKKNT